MTKDLYLYNDIAELRARAVEVEEYVNRLLINGTNTDYQKVLDCILDGKNENLFQVSRPLNVLRLVSEVEKRELESKKETTVFSGRDLYKIEDIYQETVFRLRRIEFEKPICIKDDLLQFIIDNKLSLDFLIVVIQGTYYLYNKEKIWKAISDCRE